MSAIDQLCLSSWDATTQAESLMTQIQVSGQLPLINKVQTLHCFVTPLDLQFTQTCVYALHHIIYNIATRIGVQYNSI